MFVIKTLFNSLIVGAIFASGFYVRHKLDPIIETAKRIEQSKEKATNAASALWPF
jgi:hypothetical protein